MKVFSQLRPKGRGLCRYLTIDFQKNKPKARGVALGYINIAPLGLTLKSLLALKGRIIKARGNAPGYATDLAILISPRWGLL